MLKTSGKISKKFPENSQFRIMNSKNQQLRIWAGLGTLYLVWGSTYLAIRFVVENVPSMFASGMRNVLAGTTLLLWAIFSKNFKRPDSKFLWVNAIAGTLMLAIGNGLLSIAAKWVPSGFSSLFFAISPILLVIIFWFDGEKPRRNVLIGAALGVIGVMILMSLKNVALKGGEGMFFWGVLLLFIAILGWDLGVFIVKKANINNYPTSQIAAAQMIPGGIVTLVVSGLLGEWNHVDLANVPVNAYLWFAYLYIVGSIVGFSVFSWLSKVAPPTQVATYTYVNPLVALMLGWLLGGEQLNPLMLVAALFIISAVILITLRNQKSTELKSKQIKFE